ncbi:MAG: lipopolysaccharide biosynthesis protein [Bacteroidales bacterium]|nr:lipopolysaccharide biosynthesis protein [Candidatus Cryptobacteroides equifaecalis]
MMNLKSLAKDTAIYGLSSIVGRFLNYLLSILYLYKIPAESGGYGIVTHLYAWAGFLLALLTFGMETTFFRFSGKEEEDADTVFSSSLKMVAGVGLAFVALVFCFIRPLSSALGYALHPEYIGCFALIVAMDAFQAILFARLRQQKKALKFVGLKLTFIFTSILLNLFVFLVLPKLFPAHPALESFFVSMDYGVGLIFFINLFCTFIVNFGFLPELKIAFGGKMDGGLCRRMLAYSWPLLLLSLVGLLNQVADKMLFPVLMPGPEGQVQLGIYGGCVKVAMIMALLTQAFRYAYEPIVFGGGRNRESVQTLADGMKYFIVFSLLAYMAVIFYMPILKYMVGSGYREGLGVVPVVMAAEVFMGIYFNLSFWYKLSDQTWWGAVLSAIGAVVMIGINVIFVPRLGYWACAWGGFAGYGVPMVLSWIIGQKKYPVPYDGRCIGFFFLLALLNLGVSLLFRELPVWAQLAIDTVLLLEYCYFIYRKLIAK